MRRKLVGVDWGDVTAWLFWLLVVGGVIGWGVFSHFQAGDAAVPPPAIVRSIPTTTAEQYAPYVAPTGRPHVSDLIIPTIPPAYFIPYAGNGGGPTRCRDGSYSHSSGRGTCSHHGGIAH